MLSLKTIAEKFKAQLRHLFENDVLPEANNQLNERLSSAANYFINKLDEIADQIKQSPASTDSKQHAKAYNDLLKEVFILIAEKKHLMHCCAENFSVNNYYQHKKSFIVPPFAANAYATASDKKIESPHPLLHKQLRELRNKICDQKNMPVYYVAGSATIDEMAAYLPQTVDDIVKITGFGSAKAKQYGGMFLKIIREYCEANQLSSSMHEKQPKKERKEKIIKQEKDDSKAISYNLYKEGKSVTEVAKLRNLAVSTIESHLTFYVQRGMISVNELVQTEKLVLIEPHLENYDGNTIAPIKQKLGDAVSFGEIKMVLAAKEWQKIKENI